MLQRINKIQDLKRKKDEIRSIENELACITMTDYTAIGRIHKIFNEVCEEKNHLVRRKLFLFIVVALFAPATMTGKRLPKGMRIELQKYIRDVSKCAISLNLSDLLISYKQYKDFRYKVERVWAEIASRIKC